jgi:hypothetical protein
LQDLRKTFRDRLWRYLLRHSRSSEHGHLRHLRGSGNPRIRESSRSDNGERAQEMNMCYGCTRPIRFWHDPHLLWVGPVQKWFHFNCAVTWLRAVADEITQKAVHEVSKHLPE